MTQRIVFLTFLIFSPWLTELNAQNSEKKILTEFFSIFETSPMKAFDYAFSTNKWLEQNVEGIEAVKSKFKELLPMIGDYYGYEIIAQKNAGINLKLVSCLLRYDRQPVRFIFLFYKPKDKWQVQNFNWDIDVDDDLKEAASQNRN